MTKPHTDVREARGYTDEDLDEISDIPELTDEQIAEARPFAEAFPELAASIKEAKPASLAATPRPANSARRG